MPRRLPNAGAPRVRVCSLVRACGLVRSRGVATAQRPREPRSRLTCGWLASLRAVGTHDSQVQLWDVGSCKQIGEMSGHRSRVSSLSWNGQLVSSGSRDSAIHHYDVRAPQKQVALPAATRAPLHVPPRRQPLPAPCSSSPENYPR